MADWWDEYPVASREDIEALAQPEQESQEEGKWWEKYPAVPRGSDERMLMDETGATEIVSRDKALLIQIREQREEQKLRADQEAAREYVEDALPGQIVAQQIMADIASPIERLAGAAGIPGATERADEMNRFSQLSEQALREQEEGGPVPDILQSGGRGALRSLASAIVASRAGGKLIGPRAAAGSAITGAAVQEADRAITEAKDQGLEGKEALAYVASQGAIEAIPAAVMQKMGMGGFESVIGGQVGKASIKRGVAEAIKRTGQEVPEEIVTEVGHSLANELSGVDPEALSDEQLQNVITETVVQTVMTMGMAEGARGAGAAVQGPGRKRRLGELRSLRQDRDKILRERQAQEQAAGDTLSPEQQPPTGESDEVRQPQQQEGSQRQPEGRPEGDQVGQEQREEPRRPQGGQVPVRPREAEVLDPEPPEQPPDQVVTPEPETGGEPAPSPPAPEQVEDEPKKRLGKEQPRYRQVGENVLGQPVFEDSRGVRSVEEDGVRIMESVQMVPSREGVRGSVDPENRDRRFKTKEEVGAEQEANPVSTGSKPVPVETAEDVESVAADVTPEPTDAQKEAENYRMGHIKLHGMDISIENPKGSTRSGKDRSGEEWSVKMPAHYGRIKRTEGADGDHVDVYIGDDPQSQQAFVVDQVEPETGKFDEHKVILGVGSEQEARKLYEGGFSDGSGPGRIGDMTATTVEGLKEWLRGDTSKPFGKPKKRLGKKPEPVSEQEDDTVSPSPVSEHFRKKLSEGAKYGSIREARREAGEILGEEIKSGTPAAKQADEAIEQGVVRAARDIVQESRSKGDKPESTYGKLVDLYQRQPNLSVRTSTSMQQQAYSTPAPLAYLASQLADVKPNETVYDSSAGNGMLLIASDKPLANELNEDRAAALRDQGIKTTVADATSFRPQQKPDKIIINPPFGKVEPVKGRPKKWTVDGFTTDQIDHASTLNTLKDLPEDGKAVMIIGSKGFEQGKPKDEDRRGEAYLNHKQFYDRVYDQYNVTDHFTVSGDLYQRQGAKFPVDVIVVDGKAKKGQASRPKPYNIVDGGVPAVFNSWKELADAKLSGAAEREVVGPERAPDSADRPEGRDDQQGRVPEQAGGEAESGAGRKRKRKKRLGEGTERPDRGAPDTGGLGRPGGDDPVPGVAGGEVSGERGGDAAGGDAGRPGGSGRPVDSGIGDGDAGEVLTPQNEAEWEAAINAEIEGQDPQEAVRKLREPKESRHVGKKKPAKKPIKQRAEQARSEMDEAGEELARLLKSKGLAMNAPLDPDVMQATVKFAAKAANAGALTFADFATEVGKYIGESAVKSARMRPYLERAWSSITRINPEAKPGGAAEFYGDTQKDDIMSPSKEGQVSPQKKGPPEGDTTSLEEARQAAGDEFQVPYSPASSSKTVDTLLPKNHAAAVQKGLDAIEERYGQVDKFVAKELGFTKKEMADAFSAEQVDALAMAIARHKEGNAFITGDQTGVGKGRVAAAMMIYAKKQGLAPVFVTEKPALYADMVRDLIDIGRSSEDAPFRPLMTNATSGESEQIPLPDGRVMKQGPGPARKRLRESVDSFLAGDGLKSGKDEYDAIFTTYSQLSPVKQTLTHRHAQMQKIAPKALFVLDESHNAGGSKEQESDRKSKDEGKLTRAEIIRDMLSNAPGQYFSSATYAKRPEMMDLYAKTGMVAATQGDPNRLGEAISAGGVPLQQVVSEQLVESGAYIRRERSFDGVEFDPVVVDVDLSSADKTSEVFSAINDFDDLKEVAVKKLKKKLTSGGSKRLEDSSVGQKGVSSTTFSSILWNLTDQMLLALKAGRVAQQAIDAAKEGRAPVIYVDSTLEAALNRHLEKFPADEGDPIDFSYRDLLRRYLERSREILIEKEAGKKDTAERHRLTDEELGPDAVKQYNRVEAMIDSFDADMPASPIDWIRKKIEDAGLSIAEITGRQHVLNYQDDGTPVLGERKKSEQGSSGRTNTVQKFNSGELDVVLINQSGSTGISMHASEKNPKAGQKPRHMIIAQAARNIDTFMQSLGRVHRTGQVTLPRFSLTMTNAPAENRPASVLVKKLASLNANVTASSEGSVSFDVPDILNKVGDQVVADYLTDNEELNSELGDSSGPLVETKSDGSPKIKPGIAKKATGRMALRPVSEQEEFWDSITESFQQTIAELDRINKNPLSAGVAELEARTVESTTIFEGDAESPNAFAQPAQIEKVRAKRPGEPMKPEEIRQSVNEFYGNPSDLRSARDQWVREQFEGATTKTDEMLEKIKDPESRQNARQREYSKLQGFRSLLRSYSPGESVSVWEKDSEGQLDDVVPGVVMSLKRTNQKGRPTALSKWVAEIAIGSPDRVLRMPLSQMRTQESNSELAVLPNNQMVNDEVLQEFKEMESTATETRYIGTGNILAAYSEFKGENGKVTFFTDAEGKVRRGVLLPRKFKLDRWAKDRPVVFDDADQAWQYMATGNILQTPDGALSVQVIQDQLVLRAPKSRSRGGKYTLNNDILKAADPQEFTSIGARMEMVVDKKRQQDKVLSAVLGVSGLQAVQDKELARKIVGDQAMVFTMGEGKGDDIVSPPKKKRLGKSEGEAPIRQADIVTTWSRLFGVPIKQGGFKSNMGRGRVKEGIYKHLSEVVRLREGKAFDLIVASHEVGHHVDKKMDLQGNLKELKKDDRKRYYKVRSQLQAMDYEPKGRVSEGLAEAFREILTGTAVNAYRGPEAVKWVQETVKAHPRFGPAMDQAIEHAKRFKDQGPVERARSVFGGPPTDLDWRSTRRMRLMTEMDEAYADWVDDARIIKRFSDAIRKKRPNKGEATPYELLMAYRGTTGARAARFIQEGPSSLTRPGERLGPSLAQALENLESDQDYRDAQAYAVAKHGLTLPAEYSFGMERKDAEEFVRWVRNDPEKFKRYEAFSKGITDYNNALVEMAVDAGRITRQEAERMFNAHGETYVPLLREQEEKRTIFSRMRRGRGGGSMVELPKAFRGRSRQGSGRPVKDLIESSIQRTVMLVDQGMKQQIHEAMAKQADPQLGGAQGLGGWFDRIPPGRKKYETFLGEILDQLVGEGLVTKDQARAARIAQKFRETGELTDGMVSSLRDYYGIDESVDNDAAAAEVEANLTEEPDLEAMVSFWRSDYRRPDGKHVIKVVIDGEPILYEVDGELYDALSASPQEAMSPIIQALDAGNRAFKLGATGFNTAFAVQNLIADAQTFAVNSKHATGAERATKAAEWAGKYAATVMGANKSELVDLYRDFGGEMFSAVGADRRDVQNTRRRMMRLGAKKRIEESPSDAARILADGVKGFGDKVRTFVAFTDVGPRIAEVEGVLRDHGYIEKDGKIYNTSTGKHELPTRDVMVKAMLAGGDVTYNYRRSGRKMRNLERAIPFTNAAVQSLDKTVRVYRDAINDAGAQGAAGLAARRSLVALATISGTYIAAKLLNGDDEEEQPWWLRGGYLTKQTGDGEDTKVWRVRMSREHSWLANTAIGGIDLITGDPEALKKAGLYEVTSKLPMPGGAGTVGVGLELLANRSQFLDRPIEPEWLQDVRKVDRYTDRTLETSKLIASGANAVLPRGAELSPLQFEYAASGLTGGAYYRWTDTGERAVGVRKGGLSARDVPLLRGLYYDNMPKQSLYDFYDRLELVTEDAGSEQERGMRGQATDELKMLREYESVMRLLRDAESDGYSPDGNIVALAREALGKPPHPRYPHPLYTDIPEEAEKMLIDHSVGEARVAGEGLRMPRKDKDETKEEYEKALQAWEASRDSSLKWLKRHQDSPIVKKAIRRVLGRESFQQLLRGERTPTYDWRNETWEEHQAEKKRIGRKRKAAQEFVGMSG